MRSVASFSFAMSYSLASQCLTISSAAACGMIFRRPCAFASAASKSRYFCTRFSSDQTSRMASVVKTLRKTWESKIVAAMKLS